MTVRTMRRAASGLGAGLAMLLTVAVPGPGSSPGAGVAAAAVSKPADGEGSRGVRGHEPGPVPAAAAFWGRDGHFIVGGAAAADLSGELPPFFRDAASRLQWLNYEPDRWRSDSLPELNEAFRYDHYIDLENVPAAALRAQDRFEFLAILHRTTELAVPERDAGLLPFRIVELYQRLESGFRRWRGATELAERRWIEARIIDDAGILGHYVADAAQPHHTTIHYNGWAEGVANPRGYTTARDFHYRFESQFVSSHVALNDVLPGVGEPRLVPDVRAGVTRYIRDTHALVDALYRLEQEYGFDPAAPPAPETLAFTIDRLATAATMLRSLWYTAWARSGHER